MRLNKINNSNVFGLIKELQLSDAYFTLANHGIEFIYRHIIGTERRRHVEEANTVIPILFNISHGCEVGVKGLFLYLKEIDESCSPVKKMSRNHKLKKLFKQLEITLKNCNFKDHNLKISCLKELNLLQKSIEKLYSLINLENQPSITLRYGEDSTSTLFFFDSNKKFVDLEEITNILWGTHGSIQRITQHVQIELGQIEVMNTEPADLIPGVLKVSFSQVKTKRKEG